MNDANSLTSGMMYILSAFFLLIALIATVPMMQDADFGIIQEESFERSYPPWEDQATDDENIDYSDDTLLHDGTDTGSYISEPFNGEAVFIKPETLEYVGQTSSGVIRIQTSNSKDFNSINEEENYELKDGIVTEDIDLKTSKYARIAVELEDDAEIEELDIRGNKFSQVSESTNLIVELVYVIGLVFVVSLLALAFIIPFKAIESKNNGIE